jgi:hypothetical protein
MLFALKRKLVSPYQRPILALILVLGCKAFTFRVNCSKANPGIDGQCFPET